MTYCTRAKQRGRPKGSKNINSRKGSGRLASKIRFMNFTSEDLSNDYVQVLEPSRSAPARNVCHWMNDAIGSESKVARNQAVGRRHDRKGSNESGETRHPL